MNKYIRFLLLLSIGVSDYLLGGILFEILDHVVVLLLMISLIVLWLADFLQKKFFKNLLRALVVGIDLYIVSEMLAMEELGIIRWIISGAITIAILLHYLTAEIVEKEPAKNLDEGNSP